MPARARATVLALVLGLGLALGVAWYINKMPSPFLSRSVSPSGESAKPRSTAPKRDEPVAKAPDGKPRFDFYKILPGQLDAVPGENGKSAKNGEPSAPAVVQKSASAPVPSAIFRYGHDAR